ncbi:hypothetical protein HYU23_02200 [Candidatus Woesearchaeota archaeon]|nr:hypothetical protein [Candidatus Woesearchaeota archaeon]
MIINEIKLSKQFLIFGDEVVIVTNHGKISIKENWSKDLVEKLNEKLKDFEINSAEDFSKLKEILKELNFHKYFVIEAAIINNTKQVWRFFNPSVVQIPRPIYIALSKNTGAKQFVIFSLNANNFDAVLTAGRKIADFVKKKESYLDNIKEEQLLMLIKEAIDIEHEFTNFELRIGVIFNNFIDGKYNYLDSKLDPIQQFDFVSKLIEKYSVAYVENPFVENDLAMYEKLNKRCKSSSLICMNSKVNEYTEGINKQAFNALVAKFTDVPSFATEINFFKDNNINIVADFSSEYTDVVVGLGIPLIKINDDKIGNEISKKLKIIADDILDYKNKLN